MADAILKNKGTLMFEGILFIFLGIIAVAVPWLVTRGIEVIIAALFIIGGIASLVRTFQARDVTGVFISLISALLYLVIGGLMFAYPWYAVISLTILLAIFFLAQGIAQVIMSFDIKPVSGWGWLLFSGIVSVILAILIWTGLPGTGLWVIGLLVGVNMIFFGASLLFLGLAAKEIEQEQTGQEENE